MTANNDTHGGDLSPTDRSSGIELRTDGGTARRSEVDVARVPEDRGVFVAVRPENLGNDTLTLLLNVKDATELRDKLNEQLEDQDD